MVGWPRNDYKPSFVINIGFECNLNESNKVKSLKKMKNLKLRPSAPSTLQSVTLIIPPREKSKLPGWFITKS